MLYMPPFVLWTENKVRERRAAGQGIIEFSPFQLQRNRKNVTMIMTLNLS